MQRFLLRALLVTACVLAGCRSTQQDPPPVTEAPATQPAATQPAAKAPTASERLDAWLAALATADREKLLAFREQSLSKAMPDLPPIEAVLGFAEQTGGFALVRTEESTPTRCVAILQEIESEQFARVVLEVEEDPPHLVSKLEVHPIPMPEDLLPPRMSEAEAIAALRSELERVVAADRFSGAVLVAKDGVPVFAEAYGFADREQRRANTLDTRFRLGSMNKMITAVAVVRLAQAGKLELDA